MKEPSGCMRYWGSLTPSKLTGFDLEIRKVQMHLLLTLISILLCAPSMAAVLFKADYDIIGFGATNQQIFSTNFQMAAVSAITSLDVELSHSYAGELFLTLRSPGGELFSILKRDGNRTRVGAGNGLLSGVELCTFIDPTTAALSVSSWSFTGYQPGGEYGAREWPTGAWDAGTWNITLFNDDVSGLVGGAVGSVTLNGVPVPEGSSIALYLTGAGICLSVRRRAAKGGSRLHR